MVDDTFHVLASTEFFNDEYHFLWNMLYHRMKSTTDSLMLSAAFLSKDKEWFAEEVESKYGIPSSNSIDVAYKIVTSPTPILQTENPTICHLAELHLDARAIKRVFELALEHYGILDYEVVIEENRKMIAVQHSSDDKKGKVKVPADRVVNGLEMIKLVAHEISCHILDTLNSRNLFHGMPRIGQEEVSEGHAIWTEVRYDEAWYGQPTILEQKSLLTIGIDYANNSSSFAEVAEYFFETLRDRHPDWTTERLLKESWKDALRIFRGCEDTTNAIGYAFSKDHVYLDGFLKARDFASRYSELPLCTGVCSFEEAEYIAEHYELHSFSSNLPTQSLPYRPSLNLNDKITEFLLA